MKSFGQKRIVVDLIRIPAVEVCGGAPQTTFQVGDACVVAQTSRRISPWDRCERGIPRRRIQCLHGFVVVHQVAVVSEPHRVDQARTEGVRLLEGHNLPLGERLQQHHTEGFVSREGCAVEHVSREDAVFLGEMVVDAGSEIILSDDSMCNKIVICDVPIPKCRSIRQRKYREIPQNGFVDARHGIRIEGAGDGLRGSAE